MMGVAVAGTTPAVAGWRALFDRGADLVEVPVVAWALALSAHSYETRLLPVGESGERLDHQPGYRGLALPSETLSCALSRYDLFPLSEDVFP